MGHARTERCPKSIHATGVDDVTLVARHEQRHEGAGAVVDAVPADTKGALPLVAATIDKRAAATDSSVIEQQVDVLGVESVQHTVAECQKMLAVLGVEVIRGPGPRKGARQGGGLPAVSLYARDPDENLLEWMIYQ